MPGLSGCVDASFLNQSEAPREVRFVAFTTHKTGISKTSLATLPKTFFPGRVDTEDIRKGEDCSETSEIGSNSWASGLKAKGLQVANVSGFVFVNSHTST